MSTTFHTNVHTALRTALVSALTGTVLPAQFAMEGRDFNSTLGVPWVRETCLWGAEQLMSLPAKGGVTRVDGVHLIDLFMPDGAGDNAADTAVGAVRTTFYVGVELSFGGQLVRVQGFTRAKALNVDRFIQTPLTVRFRAYDRNP